MIGSSPLFHWWWHHSFAFVFWTILSFFKYLCVLPAASLPWHAPTWSVLPSMSSHCWPIRVIGPPIVVLGLTGSYSTAARVRFVAAIWLWIECVSRCGDCGWASSWWFSGDGLILPVVYCLIAGKICAAAAFHSKVCWSSIFILPPWLLSAIPSLIWYFSITWFPLLLSFVPYLFVDWCAQFISRIQCFSTLL